MTKLNTEMANKSSDTKKRKIVFTNNELLPKIISTHRPLRHKSRPLQIITYRNYI